MSSKHKTSIYDYSLDESTYDALIHEIKKVDDYAGYKLAQNCITTINFLKEYAGFTPDEIDYVIFRVTKHPDELRLLDLVHFYGEMELLLCIPRILLPDLTRILYVGGIHPKAKRNDCPVCWILKNANISGKCATHKNDNTNDKSVKKTEEPKQKIDPIVATAPKLDDLDDKDNEMNDQTICSICFDNKKSISLVPCGHCYCFTCSKSYNTCPTCSTRVTSVHKIYL